MRTPMRRIMSSADQWTQAGAIRFALFFLLTGLYICFHRLFWYDEVFTTLTTRLPDLPTVWKALVQDNADLMGIGYFFIVRPFDKLFGYGEAAIRIPSLIAVIAGMLLVYDTARRLTGPFTGG